MMRNRVLHLLLPLLFLPAPSLTAARDRVPGWLLDLQRRPVPEWVEDAPIVLLLDENLVEVSKSKARVLGLRAVQIRTTEGCGPGPLQAFLRYKEDFFLLGAWKVRPDGDVTVYGYRNLTQQDADGNYTFSMSKINVLHTEGARVGDIVAWEYEIKKKPEANSEIWWFGGEFPTLESRFGLKMPKAWRYRTRLRNIEDVFESTDDRGYRIWEARNLPAVQTEPLGTPFRDLVPTLLVSYGPESASGSNAEFESWGDVADWYGRIFESQIVVDKNIRDAVNGLVKDASTKLEAIGEITRYVQGIRYLDVAPGRSVAEPHPAPQIFRNRYGDCEDKTVLTVAMLREIGVDARPVLALLNDAGSVVQDFPTPTQFNHVVVAIRDPGESHYPATFSGGGTDRWIVFDPTDPVTGLGDLPGALQGTHGLLVSDSTDGLVELPRLPPDSSRRESRVQVRFHPEGGIDVEARLVYTGGYAAEKRFEFQGLRGDKRESAYLSYWQSRYGRADLRQLEVSGVEVPGRPIEMDMDFWIPLPGKDLGPLKTMKTEFVLDSRAGPLPDSERTTPLRFPSGFQETSLTTIDLPPGFKPIELPDRFRAESSFGEFEWSASEEEGRLLIERRLTIRAATLDPSDYPRAREFFAAVARADAREIAIEKSSEN